MHMARRRGARRGRRHRASTSARVDRVAGIGIRQQAAAPWPLRLYGDADVLEHSQVREDAEDLKRAADAEARALMHRQAGDVLALEQELAVSGAQEPGQHVEEGRLAGAIRPDDAVKLGA